MTIEITRSGFQTGLFFKGGDAAVAVVSAAAAEEALFVGAVHAEHEGKQEPPGQQGGGGEPLAALHKYGSLPEQHAGHGQQNGPAQQCRNKGHEPQEEEQAYAGRGLLLPVVEQGDLAQHLAAAGALAGVSDDLFHTGHLG